MRHQIRLAIYSLEEPERSRWVCVNCGKDFKELPDFASIELVGCSYSGKRCEDCLCSPCECSEETRWPATIGESAGGG